MSSSRLVRNHAHSRFELLLDGRVASFIDYVNHGPTLELTHTVTKPNFRGRGLAGELVHFALSSIDAEKKRVIPTCPYVANYVSRNPEFSHLVTGPSHP